ncbi:NADH dehydrogenase [ubiquinone] iron-sulfur protein 5-A [Sesamum angolense]|uniref:NADH dehydrogenase [ubiquinone] iron-sulfur protein 5-A n=1 Tax=Sesamum angolense TaxID=2727404 RepID=A0AAE1X874_9LAMI|nr:NADH dehydrogenase [ubiquinone] iron-sulfur protein 5-A [Sesamum angolense]
MASGWGITGNKGRCYDFWMDFSDCMSRCREPKDCALLREDYLECLHHSKEVYCLTATGYCCLRTSTLFCSFCSVDGNKCAVVFQRRNRVYKEEQRQLRAASEKGNGGGDGVHH